MDFRLLGPVEVWHEGRAVDGGPRQRRHVLAVLAADAGRTVMTETLVDRVWDHEPPRGARRAVQVHLTGIRRLLTPEVRVLSRSGGYLLDVAPDGVDVHRFRRLVDRARDPACTDDRRTVLLREAIGLWRGEPLAGLPGQWAARTRQAWLRERVDAVVAWAAMELRAGDRRAVLGPVSELAGEHPFVEPLAAVLMRALHAAGRSADALEHYATIRRRLADELGTDPGSELQAVHRAILRGDLGPTRPARPAQLPTSMAPFTGRRAELAQLDALLPDPDTRIVAVSGTAGVGKTALAVQWAHRVRDHFTDGQLYVNLRGFDPDRPTVGAEEALRGFLDALGVPPGRVPAEPGAQAGLYRSLLTRRRVLVLLDNARDAEQVRPLLPGAPGCLVVVTSRSSLSGLVAAEGAHPLRLDLLSDAESRDLLSRRLGTDRVAAERPAVDAIVAYCAGLPLALVGVATHPSLPLETPARGSLGADLRTAFHCSYRTLSDSAARLFRLLALHPWPDISAPAAASLAGRPVDEVLSSLAELTGAHLLAEHRPGRYACHDLLRDYALEVGRARDSDAERHLATRRMLEHYLHTAHPAALLLNPRPRAPAVGSAAEGVALEVFPSNESMVVTVRGSLDVDSAAVLSTTLDQVLRRPAPRVVVDLSGVEFCDSTGLSTFLVGHRRAAEAGGWLRLASPTEWMARLLDTVGLTDRLGVFPGVADALAGHRS